MVEKAKLIWETWENRLAKNSPHGSGGLDRCRVARSPWCNSQVAVLVAAGLIALATLAAYCNSFAGPFVFDDQASIIDNKTIQHLWPIWKPLCPPSHGETVSGRPLVNLSLAVDYAISGLKVWSYHATNLLIHILAALALFGILRRTFLLPAMRDRWGAAAVPLALSIALLWAVHPLQTESVTYVIQRAESLVGLCYLLTLYCFVGGAGSSRPVLWYAGCVTACLLGMASKELMVSAPVIVLLYDRAFVGGSFREAWRRRYGLYLALAGAWVLLVFMVAWSGTRGKSSGFGIEVGCWEYFYTQFGAILNYLKLCVWPRPLVFCYGTYINHNVLEIAVCGVAVVLIGLAALVAIVRWPKVGFLGAWFFAILAPTTSFIPELQTVAEHRMYLPLAAVVTGLVVCGCLAGRRLVQSGRVSAFRSQVLGGCLVLSVIVVLAIFTFNRNIDYKTDMSIWQDTVDKRPNDWAYNNVGNNLQKSGRIDDAIVCFRKALEINPNFSKAHYNLGTALQKRGQIAEAIAHYRRALDITPDFIDAHNNLGAALMGCGQIDEAIVHFQKVLETNPDSAGAHNNLGFTLAGQGRLDEAITHYHKALEINPDYAEAHNNLGNAFQKSGQIDEAIAQFHKALEITPDYAEAHVNLGNALQGRGQTDEAITQFQKALEISPNLLEAHFNLGAVLASRGRDAEAVEHFQKALDLATARNNRALADMIRSQIRSIAPAGNAP